MVELVAIYHCVVKYQTHVFYCARDAVSCSNCTVIFFNAYGVVDAEAVVRSSVCACHDVDRRIITFLAKFAIAITSDK